MIERSIDELKKIATSVRIDIVEMTYNAGKRGAHLGGSMSCVEILVALYMGIMKCPEAVQRSDRDRFILSKGHAAMALYAVLHQKGIIPEYEIKNALKDGSLLCEHPKMNDSYGIEVSGGSLGQGLSIGAGMALALKKKNNNANVYVLLGDGECNEGQVWEAAHTIQHYRLNNVVTIVDKNGLQFDGRTKDVQDGNRLKENWESYGFDVVEIDGHSFEQLIRALSDRNSIPKVIIANTVKGKGISFAENATEWHSNFLTDEQYFKAKDELKKSD